MSRCLDSSTLNEYCDVKGFYKDRSVFVTGVTGFLGKVLVEKLLRSCIETGNVYVLIRSKRGKDVNNRMEELLKSQIFDRLKVEKPTAIEKLIPVSGDVSLPNLGLSEAEERNLIDKVSIVFHTAATIKLDEELRKAILLNTGGVLNILQLCQKMQYLEAFIHVSTAYSNCNLRGEVKEMVYPVSDDPVGFLQAFHEKWLTDEMVLALNQVVTKDRLGAYTFSKALGENILLNERKQLPIAIVRPSIITCSWKEPYPGWVDSIRVGTAGITLASMRGLLRFFPLTSDVKLDLIPVDICSHLMISAAWHLAKNKPNNMPVYHCASVDINPLSMGEMLKYANAVMPEIPANQVFWYPGVSTRSRFIPYKMCVLIVEFLPVIIFDILNRFLGKKHRLTLLRAQQQIVTIKGYMGYFGITKTKFMARNHREIWDAMSAKDKEEYNFDIRQVDWKTLGEQQCLGVKTFVLKEDIATLPQARRNMQRMLYIRNFTYLLGILVIGALIGMLFNLI